MFGWLKRLFGSEEVVKVAKSEPVQETKAVEPATPKKTTKKTKSKKGTGKCDFDKLTKTQLLAEAKHRGVKANASMKKADILKRLK